MYDGPEQTKMRLAETVVAYDGKPVYVTGVTAGNKLNLVKLPKMNDNFVCGLNDPKLNFLDLRLGYVNTNNYAAYMRRTAGRQQRQGLHKGVVIIGDRDLQNKVVLNWEELIHTPEFFDAFQGIYPNFADVVQRMLENPKIRSMAFHRRFALHRDEELGFYELRYRGRRVAWGDPNQFNLPSEYSYMTEMIQAEGINLR